METGIMQGSILLSFFGYNWSTHEGMRLILTTVLYGIWRIAITVRHSPLPNACTFEPWLRPFAFRRFLAASSRAVRACKKHQQGVWDSKCGARLDVCMASDLEFKHGRFHTLSALVSTLGKLCVQGCCRIGMW